MTQRDVVIVGAARSAIGTFGGALAGMELPELAGTVMKEAVKRSGVDPRAINYVTVGNTIPTDNRFAYVARVAAMSRAAPIRAKLLPRDAAKCNDFRLRTGAELNSS